MSHDHKKRQFSSQWGFVLSAVGSAVGMANVWGFPAKMGGLPHRLPDLHRPLRHRGPGGGVRRGPPGPDGDPGGL